MQFVAFDCFASYVSETATAVKNDPHTNTSYYIILHASCRKYSAAVYRGMVDNHIFIWDAADPEFCFN